MARQLMLQIGLLLTLGGCGGKDSPEPTPRTRDAIFKDIQSLPTLYLTAKTNKRIIAGGDKGSGAFVDKETGEICWQAMECGNPKCPGRTGGDEPFIFITPDPGVFVESDGVTFGYDIKKRKPADSATGGACPECLKNRNPKKETQAERDEYIKWIKPHLLPESAKRKKELEAELEGGS